MPRPVTNELMIACLRIGQGDCTVVKCPTGELFIIDMGTAEREREPDFDKTLRDWLAADDILGQEKTVDALILTHPDKDHYNRVGMLYTSGVRIRKVYHSNGYLAYIKGTPLHITDEFGNVVRKVTEMSHHTVRRMCTKNDGSPDLANIRRVTYTAEAKNFATVIDVKNSDKVNVTPIPQGNGIDQYSPERGIKIHDNGGCRIYLLCGDIRADDDDDSDDDSRSSKRRKLGKMNNYERRIDEGKPTNMASIITLIDFAGKRFLFCADAVQETEEFVLNNYPDITEVEILRAPHHGSNTFGSSHDEFVIRMNPRVLVVSVAKEPHVHAHPTCETITRYVDICGRLRRKEDGSDADNSTYGCYYKADEAQQEGHKRRKGAYFDGNVTKQATVRVTGWHDNTVFTYPP